MDESQIVARIVESLRKAREEKGISRYRSAKETGLSSSGIRHMEEGDVTPTLFFLLKISAFLEIDLADSIAQALSEGQKRTPPKKRRARVLANYPYHFQQWLLIGIVNLLVVEIKFLKRPNQATR